MLEETAEQVSDRVIDVEAVKFIAWLNWERKIVKWLIKMYCEDVLQMLFTDSDSEGEQISDTLTHY